MQQGNDSLGKTVGRYAEKGDVVRLEDFELKVEDTSLLAGKTISVRTVI